MPNKITTVRKIHESLRLHFGLNLSLHQICQCADVSTGTI